MNVLILFFFSLYFGLLPFDNLKELSGDTITKYLGLILIALLLIYFFLNQIKTIKISRFVIVIFIIFAVYSLTYFALTNNFNSNYLRFCFLALLFFLSSQYDMGRVKLEKVYKFSTIILTSISLLSIILNLAQASIDRTHYFIFPNMTVDANIYCASMLFPILYLFNNIFNENNRFKYLYIFMLIVLLASVFLAGSRGGLIALGCGFVCVYFFGGNNKKNARSNKIMYLLIFLLVFYFLIPYLPDEISNRLSLDTVIKDKASSRFVIWEYSIEKFFSSSFINKIFGYGFLSFKQATGLVYVSHNLFIQTLIEGGIFMICMLSYLFYVLLAFFKKHKNYLMLSYCISVIIMSLSLDVITSRFLWNAFILFAFNYYFASSDLKSSL